MLAMLQTVFDGSGNWISKHLEDATEALDHFVPEDEDMLRLSDAVQNGLRLLASSGTPDDAFNTDIAWAYDAFVRSYFLAYSS